MAETAEIPVLNIEDAEPQPISIKTEGALVDSKSNLFFQFGVHQEGAEEEEAAAKEVELQAGKDFQAIVCENTLIRLSYTQYIVSESAQKFRDVTMTVSLKGIKVSEPNSKVRFDIKRYWSHHI